MSELIRVPRRQVLAGSLGLGAATLAAPRLGAAQDEKVVRIRYKADIKVIEPAGNQVVDEQFIIYATQSNLITWAPGEKWVWQLDAAESIEQVDDTHVAFTLRPGIMFTNGYGELTAEDVKYSLERMMNPELNATDRQEFEQFDHVEVTGTHSGVIVTKGPVATMWTGILPRYFCAIVSKKAWEEIGATTRTLLPNEIPCFGGPYVLAEWVPGQRVVLTRNDLWNGEPVYYDRIEYILIPDDKVAELAYEAGEVDITQISIGSAATYRDNPLPDTDLYVRPTTGFVWVGMNVDHAPYDNILVREAVRKAVAENRISVFGEDKLIDGQLADMQWERNTRSRVSPQAASGIDLIDQAALAPAHADAPTAAGPAAPAVPEGYTQARARREMAEAEEANRQRRVPAHDGVSKRLKPDFMVFCGLAESQR